MPQFTKDAIRSSFIKLLNKASIDKITVKDIVDDCQISRNTFYYHYADIDNLLLDVFNLEAHKVSDLPLDYTNWQEGFAKAITFAFENKRAFYHVYHSARRETIERYLYTVIYHLMHGYAKKVSGGRTVSEENIAFISSFFTGGLCSVTVLWLNENNDVTPEQFVKRLSVFEGAVQSAVDKCIEN